MAKAFSIASWNVEHFKQDPTRVDRVIDFVAAQNPDMLALYEVESKEVFASVTAKFPGYTFQITEGRGKPGDSRRRTWPRSRSLLSPH